MGPPASSAMHAALAPESCASCQQLLACTPSPGAPPAPARGALRPRGSTPDAAEEGVIPDKGLVDEKLQSNLGIERTSLARDIPVSQRGGKEFLHAVESTRSIKVPALHSVAGRGTGPLQPLRIALGNPDRRPNQACMAVSGCAGRALRRACWA